MWSARWSPPLAMLALARMCVTTPVSAFNSYWYDWGLYGPYPQLQYESFGASSPWANILKADPRCNDGYVFIEPRGPAVATPGPVVLDQMGNLVWTDTRWGQAMDVKVQKYQGNDYITFWHGSDNGTFGEGYYLMLDESYEVFRKIAPAGSHSGDLHEFRITARGTALMTMYERMPYNLSAYGISEGWIVDSMFQEMDIETGELIFEWRASEHYAVHETYAPVRSFGGSPAQAFDFFHINSIDQDADGNYLISSRYMCAVACIAAASGEVLWQLGGAGNTFVDLSNGAASNFTWQHHAAWAGDNLLSIFDNGAYDKLHTAEHSRALLVEVDVHNKTAALAKDFVAPQRFLVPSQGSVQLLPGPGNVLVGWGHTPAFTEFAPDGGVLCDVHISPVNIAALGWVKNYRTFKSPWVGRPRAAPSIAMRPRSGSAFVSWNGATEVDRWVLQSGARDGAFRDHASVPKLTFETEIAVPADAGELIRTVAFDKEGNLLGCSEAVSRREATKVAVMYAPSRGSKIASLPMMIACGAAVTVSLVLVLVFRNRLHDAFCWVRGRSGAYKYEALSAD